MPERMQDGRHRKDELTEDFGAAGTTQAEGWDESAAKQEFLERLARDPQIMLSTAGSSFEGWHVEEYLATLSTDGVVGSSFPSEADAIASDIAGTRSLELARKMERAKRIAWEELLWRAYKLGADGVLGVRYDVYMPFAGAFAASVTATAVELTADDPV